MITSKDTAIVTPEVLQALADMQRFEPTDFKEDVEKLTDMLLDYIGSYNDLEKVKDVTMMIQDFRGYAERIYRLYPQNHPNYSES